MSNSRIFPTLPQRFGQFDVLTQHMTGQESGYGLVPDLGVLRREHPVVFRGKVKELMRAGAVLGRGQPGLAEQLVPQPQRLADRHAISLSPWMTSMGVRIWLTKRCGEFAVAMSRVISRSQ